MISKVIKGRFLFAYLMIILLTAVCFTTNTYADEHNEEDNRFDGSEFNATSFEDISFAKGDYKELRSMRTAVGQLLRESSNSLSKEDNKLSRKHQGEKGILTARDDNDRGPLSGGEHLFKKERSGPITDLPGDWVPDKIDLTSNGGFTTSPDNGSPVPYRLNGHVDIERGRP